MEASFMAVPANTAQEASFNFDLWNISHDVFYFLDCLPNGVQVALY